MDCGEMLGSLLRESNKSNNNHQNAITLCSSVGGVAFHWTVFSHIGHQRKMCCGKFVVCCLKGSVISSAVTNRPRRSGLIWII